MATNDADKASVEYRNYRMSCGVKDPVMLDEIEEAYYKGATRQEPAEWSEGIFDKDIECIRTDAFIEKAEEFFIERFEVENYNDNIDIDGTPIFNYCRFIDDFRKHMKG